MSEGRTEGTIVGAPGLLPAALGFAALAAVSLLRRQVLLGLLAGSIGGAMLIGSLAVRPEPRRDRGRDRGTVPDGAEEYTVDCRTLSHLYEGRFSDIDEELLGSSLYLPDAAFEGTALEEYGYVLAVPASADRADGGGELIQVQGLSELPDGVEGELVSADGRYRGGIRTATLTRIFGTDDINDVVGALAASGDGTGTDPAPSEITLTITPFEPTARIDDPLTVYPEYADRTAEGFNCYLSGDLRRRLGVAAGDPVEAYSEATGGRLSLRVREHNPVWNFNEDDPDDRIAGIDGLSRRLLGIDVGDYAVLEWNGTRTKVRCLTEPEGAGSGATAEPEGGVSGGHPATDGGEPDTGDALTINLPHTVRDGLGVNIDDCIYVRRDVSYVLAKKMALSVLSLLLIVWAGLQAIDQLLPPLSPGQWIVVVVCLLGVALGVLWVLLYPDRKRCNRTGVADIG